MSAIANQKFNHLYLQGYQLTRTQESEDLTHTAPPASRKQLETDASPQFLMLSPYPHHY
jgi:hypothetical protein